MAKKYKMKNLGYKRTPADGAVLLVAFPNKEIWEVPVQLVADSRDEWYKDEEEDTLGFPQADIAPVLEDWAASNMNWSDLAPYAKQIADPPKINLDNAYLSANFEVRGL